MHPLHIGIFISPFFFLGSGCGSDNQQNAWTCTIYTRRWRGALILCFAFVCSTLDMSQIKTYKKDVFASKLLWWTHNPSLRWLLKCCILLHSLDKEVVVTIIHGLLPFSGLWNVSDVLWNRNHQCKAVWAISKGIQQK